MKHHAFGVWNLGIVNRLHLLRAFKPGHITTAESIEGFRRRLLA